MAPTELMTQGQRDVVVSLHAAERAAGRPGLPPDEVPVARAWLREMLPDSGKLGEHVRLLAELCGCPAPRLKPRRDRRPGKPPPVSPQPAAYPFSEFLPDGRADAVAEGGPDVLSEDELGLL